MSCVRALVEFMCAMSAGCSSPFDTAPCVRAKAIDQACAPLFDELLAIADEVSRSETFALAKYTSCGTVY